MSLYKDEKGTEGIEYPVDQSNKRIDILAIDKNGIPVVIELKVNRGYERTIGQALYYKNMIKQKLHEKKVRIIVIAWEISPYLKTAMEGLPDIELFEYELNFTVKPVNLSKEKQMG